MRKFERNWNVFGIGEPLLFPIKRAGQPEIHLAKLLKEFFEFKSGKCDFYEYNGNDTLRNFNGEIIMKWLDNRNQVLEEWVVSEVRGCSTPGEARNMDPNLGHLHMKIKDADLVQSLKNLLANYTNCKIDLAKIIGIGGEGTVLDDSSERLNLTLFPLYHLAIE